MRVNVWTVRRDKIKWPLQRDGRQWRFDCISIVLYFSNYHLNYYKTQKENCGVFVFQATHLCSRKLCQRLGESTIRLHTNKDFCGKTLLQNVMPSLKSTLYIENNICVCLLQTVNNLKPKSMGYELLIGQSNDFWRANKLYARQKSCDYHYYQYTRPNRTNLFHKARLFNMKSCCELQIPFTARTLPFGPRKGAFQRGQFVIWPRVVIVIIF